MPTPIRLTSVADFAAFSVHAFCDDCQHCATLDMQALALRLGGDHPFDRLKRALRCKECGSKAVSVSVGGTPGDTGAEP